MKNSEIHIGFLNAEVRDSIAKGLNSSYEKGNKVYTHKGNQSRLERAAEKLQIAQDNYDAVKEEDAWMTIMSSFGWNKFDVSDETIMDVEGPYSLNFIGTEKEYNNLLEIINNCKRQGEV